MGFDIKGWHVIVVILAVALMMGWITTPYWNPPGTGTFTCPTCAQTFGSQAALDAHRQSAHGTIPGTITHPAAQIQLQVVDYIASTGVTTATTTVDFCQASSGVFDLLGQADTMTHATNPDTYNVFFADGAQLLIHTDCSGDPSNGLDYYDGWYYVVLHEGNPIYFLTASMLSQVSSSPHFTYSVSSTGAVPTGSTVTWTSGTTNFWDIGKLFIYTRTTAAGLNLYLSYSGTTLSSVVDGSTWITGSSTANATLAGTSEHLNLLCTFDNANLGWGWKMQGVTVQGQFLEYPAILVMSTNMTAIDSAQLSAEGWYPINDNTLYAEKAFYKIISPMYTTKGSIASPGAIQVPVYDAAASSAKYIFKFWILDFQLESNAAIGSVTTTIPTVYGMVTAYGPGAMIQARAYSSSSGAGSGQAITCWATKS